MVPVILEACQSGYLVGSTPLEDLINAEMRLPQEELK
jgi:hypothetical protein